MTTLGTAASISISVPIGPRTAGGASSLRKRPIAIESGAAMMTAASEVTIVPKMNVERAERRATGSHPLDQRKLTPKWWIAGQAPVKIRQPIAAIDEQHRGTAAAR